jgi:ADP-ribosylglycohydrolase
MLGAIFGDITGSIYEFNNIKTTDFELYHPSMTFTDDSILTIAVADWLLGGELSKEALVVKLKEYVRRYPYPMGGNGARFTTWAYSRRSEPYNRWGNGSAMRVAASLGGDSDTLACITGGIAEAFYGMNGVPSGKIHPASEKMDFISYTLNKLPEDFREIVEKMKIKPD